ncbi:hypothetical protein BDK51DRAFT_48446 [Blyttiomyces helicus]|uniref:Uncharacterized protein n=1 Tax=Blyttiomyces helicus TaxID=388810 RepID=A0A4P9VZ17_9FUNG|nr:hypothetical protein BDK51DRAFT_48446 [Blyttiomyces helicus]|eukprot:RKO85004.1 hypothetical protein BDK51DRAFT_48446 [Blyttiomyces helicus]
MGSRFLFACVAFPFLVGVFAAPKEHSDSKYSSSQSPAMDFIGVKPPTALGSSPNADPREYNVTSVYAGVPGSNTTANVKWQFKYLTFILDILQPTAVTRPSSSNELLKITAADLNIILLRFLQPGNLVFLSDKWPCPYDGPTGVNSSNELPLTVGTVRSYTATNKTATFLVNPLNLTDILSGDYLYQLPFTYPVNVNYITNRGTA